MNDPGWQSSIDIVCCHAAGEVGDVIVGGVPPPPGETLWEQSRWIERDGRLRDFVLNEPRGGVFRHVNLLVPPKSPDADIGFIIMEPADTPPMSGSNAICVATVVLQTGIVPMHEPVTELVLEAPGGLVPVSARCAGGKVVSVRLTNLPSFVLRRDALVEVEGFGPVRGDLAFGGDSFYVVSAQAHGLEINPHRARKLAELGSRIVSQANRDHGFSHPTLPDWRHVSFCLFTSEPQAEGDSLTALHAVAIRPGKIDRSPTGTGVSAHLALLHARGVLGDGQSLRARSIIGSEFLGRVAHETRVGPLAAIVPTVEGRGWVYGTRKLFTDVGDPWPSGYRLSDTWPGA